MEKWPNSETNAPDGEKSVDGKSELFEKKENLHASLKERIGIITEIRETLENGGLDGRELFEAAVVKIDQTLEKYSPAAEEKINEISPLIKRKEEIEKIFDERIESESGDIDLLIEESERLSREISKLNDDPNVRLIFTLRRGKDSLRRKAEEYERAKLDPGGVKLPRKKGLKEVLSGKKPLLSGLSVTYFLNDDEMDKLDYDRGMQGAHFPGSMVNLVRDSGNREENDEITRHEAIHAVYEAFLWQKADGEREIERDVDAYKDLAEGERVEYLLRMKLESLPERARKFIYSAKGELIANFEELAKGNLHTELSEFRYAIAFLRSKKKELQSQVGEGNKLVSDYLGEYERQLTGSFRNFYQELGDLFFVAEREGMSGELKSAMILFDPAEYRKISRFFRDEIGKEKYDMHISLRRLTKEPFFAGQATKEEEILDEIYGRTRKISWDNEAETIIRVVRSNPDLLTDKVKSDLKAALEAIEENAKLELAAWRGAGGCIRSCRTIKEIGSIVKEDVSKYLRLAVEDCLNAACEEAVDGNLSGIKEALSLIDHEYDDFVASFFMDYAREAADELGGEEKLFSSALWREIRSNQRTKDLAKRIENPDSE